MKTILSSFLSAAIILSGVAALSVTSTASAASKETMGAHKCKYHPVLCRIYGH